MQCWCNRLLQPPLQIVKLSPSAISSKQIGQISSSSLEVDDDEDEDDDVALLGDGGGFNRDDLERVPFWFEDIFEILELTRAWNFENKPST